MLLSGDFQLQNLLTTGRDATPIELLWLYVRYYKLQAELALIRVEFLFEEEVDWIFNLVAPGLNWLIWEGVNLDCWRRIFTGLFRPF